jgi:polyhydroxyalkanoate synthesis regulator phasin
MNENVKKIAFSGSALVLAIAMGFQTFIFGKNDMQTLKEEIALLTQRVAKLEAPIAHD